ncbi:MAG: hypothetical protein MUF14_07295, partial [Hyphomonadaceae bacterium]|nr:hypothetical protein [Hyphomonadaceae bacterium]
MAGTQPNGPVVAPDPPAVRLSIGVTGHRSGHPVYAANRARIETVFRALLDRLQAETGRLTPPFGRPFAPVRLHTLLADGTDQMAAEEALTRGWELVAPLPFGARLNLAINAQPATRADADALLAGQVPADPAVEARARAIEALYPSARLFALADDDASIEAAFKDMLSAPADRVLTDAFRADCSARIALAGRLLAEQCDVLIAVWDGARTSFQGGTGHTIATVLAHGGAVIWINAHDPENWRVLDAPEALQTVCLPPDLDGRDTRVARLVRGALLPLADPAGAHGGGHSSGHGHNKPHAATVEGVAALDASRWRDRSDPVWHAYRRIEALFGGDGRPWRSLHQIYARPDNMAADTTGADSVSPASVADAVSRRHHWADAISSRLSDCYRGGMVISFVLSAAAIVGGIAYLPIVDTSWKWPFALAELVLLSAILALTSIGQARRWHGRWFETRRVAEYLRHGHLLLALGAARAPGRWPAGTPTSWPEHYARHALREAGLPQATITADYLRTTLRDLLDSHVTVQRDYHRDKARRLTQVHHKQDMASERLFQIAVVSVSLYLCMALAEALGQVDGHLFKDLSKVFTFLGVALPTLGGAIAGIRYFGDFERFAAVSQT